MGWTIRGSNRGGDEVFRAVQTSPEAYPSLLYNGGQSVMLTTHVLLELSCKAVLRTYTPPLPPLPAQECHGVTFTSYIYLSQILPSPSKYFHTLRPLTVAIQILSGLPCSPVKRCCFLFVSSHPSRWDRSS